MHDGAKPWTNETLAARVIEGIDQAIDDHPEAVGWIRANTPGCSLNAQSNTSLEEIADRLQHPIKVQSNIIFTKASNGSANSLPECLACTYEEIFLSFAKKFFNSRVGESLCIESICNMLQEKYKIEIEERLKNLGNFVLLNIDPDEIDNIRLEFATNKLVDITSNGKFFVWRLSEFGLQYLKLLHERSFYGA